MAKKMRSCASVFERQGNPWVSEAQGRKDFGRPPQPSPMTEPTPEQRRMAEALRKNGMLPVEYPAELRQGYSSRHEDPEIDAFFASKAEHARGCDCPDCLFYGRNYPLTERGPGPQPVVVDGVRRIANIRARLHASLHTSRVDPNVVALREYEPVPEQLPPAPGLTPEMLQLREEQRQDVSNRRAKAEAVYEAKRLASRPADASQSSAKRRANRRAK